MNRILYYLIPLLLLTHCGSNPTQPDYTTASCITDEQVYALRAQELQAIVAADQLERTGEVDWKNLSSRDMTRRKRVAEIFAEGCFKNSKDYAAAALVFQHGITPDHFLQTGTPPMA